ncbi:Asp/Glu/hydantoin racemase [Rathayibacter sp. AY1E8]|uniref:aspartate/glutamate racemase family protein n=1 Tax=unclassified Rathayibacter TaxID=2609250 RepID=UPI000CE79CC9|nr:MULTISPECIES: aspartate/glutamate racemase family protein [unclassified Rathayibacter]PPF44335.1 Asp/Glu/hydantoin racemase [Rathayibacter sp. AY1A1]PPG18801.1 Asp/Glu/hydantoin racemase [Rathayibacter sp. AY1E8]PPH01134.1 Asp/Glu/hydantoin racemase [Rathayibacter sp. AY1G9]
MRIAVVNCNTTESMTETAAARARLAVGPGTEIVAITPSWGVASAEGWYDSFLSAAAVLHTLERLPAGIDGVVMAGFGEHGREGARELLDVPVVDITEASAHLAMLLGRRYGVVTTVRRAVGQIEDSLTTAGLIAHCAAIEDTGLGVLELEEDPQATLDAFVAAGERAIARGAEVICLGCAGMAGLEEHVGARLPVPVVDGVAAAAALVETLVRQQLGTSRIDSYARPLPKERSWPGG